MKSQEENRRKRRDGTATADVKVELVGDNAVDNIAELVEQTAKESILKSDGSFVPSDAVPVILTKSVLETTTKQTTTTSKFIHDLMVVSFNIEVAIVLPFPNSLLDTKSVEFRNAEIEIYRVFQDDFAIFSKQSNLKVSKFEVTFRNWFI